MHQARYLRQVCATWPRKNKRSLGDTQTKVLLQKEHYSNGRCAVALLHLGVVVVLKEMISHATMSTLQTSLNLQDSTKSS